MELDGFDLWAALTAGARHPRSELLLNHDPCRGGDAAHSCDGVEWAFRSGELKMLWGVQPEKVYPVPTTAAAPNAANTQGV